MSKYQMGNFVAKNWYLFLLLAVCVGVPAYYLLSQSPQAAATGNLDAATNIVQVVRATPKPQERVTPQDKAREAIASHEAKIQAEPGSEDVPALWAAMGNLYRSKLGDYHEAARCYENIFVDHPDWPGMRGVYIQLATCYERTGDIEGARRVYLKMTDEFPEESREYEYAWAKLQGEI